MATFVGIAFRFTGAMTAPLVPLIWRGTGPERVQPRRDLRRGSRFTVAGSMAWTSWQ
jgi:hypothetical protein